MRAKVRGRKKQASQRVKENGEKMREKRKKGGILPDIDPLPVAQYKGTRGGGGKNRTGKDRKQVKVSGDF